MKDNKQPLEIFGRPLKEWRKEYGLTQKQFSDFILEKTGFKIWDVVIADYENGKRSCTQFFKRTIEDCVKILRESPKPEPESPFFVDGKTLKELRVQKGISLKKFFQSFEDETLTVYMVQGWEKRNFVPKQYTEKAIQILS